jgi:uncharacterized protein
MHRVFLDANVLFSATYRADSGLRQLWHLKNVVLYTSRYTLEEARANLDRDDQRRRLNELSGRLVFCEAGARHPPRGVSLPEKDVPILLAALAGQCTHLLTGEIRHFGPYLGRRIEGVWVMLPGDYLKGESQKK